VRRRQRLGFCSQRSFSLGRDTCRSSVCSLQSARLLGACAKHLDQRDSPTSGIAEFASGLFISSLFWLTSNKVEARRHQLYVQVICFVMRCGACAAGPVLLFPSGWQRYLDHMICKRRLFCSLWSLYSSL
jgi:hypothetical protein